MKVLVVGGGGREHAIIRKLKESPRRPALYAAPGNGGIASDAVCVPIAATDVAGVVSFAVQEGIDYVVVAPDDPLVLGMVDALAEKGIPAFGPNKAAAILEGSKVFSKNLMKKYGIPTAAYETFADAGEAAAYVRANRKYPLVVKADGLALGKGVIICMTREEAKDAVKSNRGEWRGEELNFEALGQLLQQHADWLFPVITAALDVQLRSFAPCAEVPIFAYNFTMKKPNLQAEQAITRAFTALNLTTEGAACNSAPPQITVLDSGDLADWSGCRDRLVLLRTSTGAPLKPLFDALDEYERQTRFGGVLPRRLSTVPIVRSRTIFDRSDTVDIELPSSINSLTNYDLDLLRIAAAHTLTKANAAEVYRRWYGPMTSLARYQLDPFEVWRDAVVRVFLEANLPSHGMAFTAAYDGLETAQEAQSRTEAEREETLRKALELLGDQSRYEDEIIPKPATADEATRLLDEEREAVAFRHTPTRGPESGKHFIIFSNASLFRLLKRVNMDELLFDTFKKRASALAILVRQSYAVKFGTVPFNGFWIVDKKF